MAALNLDQTIEKYHRATSDFINGNPEPYKELFSRRDDVSLGNPFNPIRRGWNNIAEVMDRASSNYADGEIIGFETVVKYETPGLAFIVQIERFKARISGKPEMSTIALRTTSIFRPESDDWKIVHRLADAITAPQPMESVVQK